MRSSLSPEPLPLTGADCFLRAFDDEIRRYHGASHVSQLVLRLGQGFDVDAFRSVLAAASAAAPILRAPIRRRLGVGPPVYRMDLAPRAAPPGVDVHEGTLPPDEPPALPAVFFARMNAPFAGRRGRLLHFDVVRYPDGRADVAMSWLHMLFDGAGSERFVAALDACHAGRPPAEALVSHGAGAPAARVVGLAERGRKATAWRRHMRALAAAPPRSLAGPLRPAPQALRYEVDTLTEAETAAVAAHARAHAGAMTPMLYYLAAAVRAHHAVFRARGHDPGSYVVPLPVNLRHGADAIFRTHVSLIWFQVAPAVADDFAGLIGDLKRQRLAAIKAGLVEGGSHAMDFARLMPQRLYARMARRSLGGELCSFFFAFTDRFLPACARFCGAPILNGFHAPAVPPSPGSCAAMSLRGERLNLTHVAQAGVLTDDERRCFRARLRDDLIAGP